jgi:PAS domain S-box-containing protein
MGTQLRRTGIDEMGDQPWGTHFCLFYETKEDLLDLLIPFFKAGLADHEFCLYVASEPIAAEAAERALRQAVPHFEHAQPEGQIEIISHLDWYLAGGHFDPLRVRQSWIEKLDHALAHGFEGMRFAANTFWLSKQDWQSFADYEAKMDEAFCELPVLAACAYPLERCSAADMLDVVQHHKFTVARRHRAWERLEGSELGRAHAEIHKLNADLERQVEERTAQLAAANVQLTGEVAERQRSEEALRATESRLRRVIDTIPIMAWTVRPDGTVDYLNQRWIDYTGLSLEQYVAEPTRPIHPEDIPRGIENWLAATAAGEPYEQEMRLQGANGEFRWFLIRTEPLRDEAGKIVQWYGVSTDIDDRKRAEGEVNRQAARAETLARIAARLNKNLELEAVIQAVCEEAVNIFKVSQATMSLYDKKRDLLVYAGGVNMPPEYGATIEPITRARFEELLRALGPIMVVPDIQALPDVPNAEFSSRLDVRTVVTSAMLRDQQLIGALVVGVNGRVREFANDELTLLKAVSDLAAQAIANAQLLQAANEQHEQLRALSAKLAEAQEAERRAIARELHDEIGQLLYAVGANLEVIKLSSDAVTLAGRLADSAALVDEAIHQVRDLALELRPSMLDDFGLLPALAWLVERQAQRAGYRVDFMAEPPDLRLPASLDTAVYRVVQIALTNVARHAQAQQVAITVRQEGSELELLIHDDGVGFDVAVALERAQQGATLGLPSMRERVRLAGGTLAINSAPGQGTTIRARFPIDPPRRP